MAASCVRVIKCSVFGRTFAPYRLLYQSGASVTSFLQQHYSNSVICNSNNNDNSLSDNPDSHHFAYDTKTDELTSIDQDLVERGIGRTLNEQYSKYLLEPDQPVNSKILRFSIIGIPNSGKSTLTNQLMNWKVSPVSSKVHTTRKNTVAVMTDDRTQIVFVDTPGVVTSRSRLKHNLNSEMVSAPADSLQVTDMIGVVVDASNHWTCKELGQNILQLLHLNSHLPSILILNKVDLVKEKESLLEITRVLTNDHIGGRKNKVSIKRGQKTMRKALFEKYNLQAPNPSTKVSNLRSIPVVSMDDRLSLKQQQSKETITENKEDEVETWQAYHARMQSMRHSLKGKKGWPRFNRVFMISALNKDGVYELRDYLLSQAMPGNWEFHSSFVTDQDPLILAKDLLWEKLLETLPEEVPYTIRIETEMWEVNHNDILMIVLNVICKKKKHLHMIIGTKGSNIRCVSEVARQAMMDAFRIDVHLRVHVILENS